MKESVQIHTDYAENVLPKVKRAYIKKCQDVEVRTSRPSALLWPSVDGNITRRITNQSRSRPPRTQNLTSVTPILKANITVTLHDQWSPRHSL